MKTEALLKLVKIKKTMGNIPFAVTGIQMDSRKVEPGDIFVCIEGHVTDGHLFADEAVNRGAVLIIAEKEVCMDHNKAGLMIVKNASKVMARLAHQFYNDPSSNLTLFGVTGTNGKTTVSHLIHQFLSLTHHKSAVAGTLGFRLNGECIPAKNTTSDVITNLEMSQKAVQNGCSAMTFEASSQGIANGRMWGIDIDIAVFTNLSQDHLDEHQTMEQYGQAKGLLFSQLGQDLQRNKYVILNEDDPWSKRYSQMTPFEEISYGIDREADFRAGHIAYGQQGTTFTLYSPQGVRRVKSNLIGKFNVYNLLASVAALYAFGLEIDRILDKVPLLYPQKGRMEKLNYPEGPEVYIDYAHTPDAIEKVIESVVSFKKNRLIVLIAGGANKDVAKRPLMAEKASLADYVVITTNNPGHEPPEHILSDFEKGMAHDHYVAIGDREEAVKHAINISNPDDIVILTDKGHETTMLVGDKNLPHSDKKIALHQMDRKFRAKHLLNR